MLHWFLFKVIFPRLPLMWKIKFANLHMKWRVYNTQRWDKLLGKKVIQVVSVKQDWVTYNTGKCTVRIRDITYRWKRERLPFAYPGIWHGPQCNKEDAVPLHFSVTHETICKVNDTIADVNVTIARYNEKQDQHAKLKESIVGHEFKTYDHNL
jgi:hypothetical protein